MYSQGGNGSPMPAEHSVLSKSYRFFNASRPSLNMAIYPMLIVESLSQSCRCVSAQSIRTVFDQIIYTSRAVLPVVSPLDVVDILDQAARHNPDRQVTGVLTYVDDQFVQMIEGPGKALDTLMDVIRRDPRHTDIDVLDRTSVSQRAFPDWAMLFPMFTPETALELTCLLEEGRRAAPKYRDILLRMGREQTHALAAA